MIYENKKLAISGIAGVVIASLIITSVEMTPWSSLEMMLGFPQVHIPASPIIVRLTISGFTEPRGIGSQALLTVNVTSSVNASNVVLQISLFKAHEIWSSKGIDLISENAAWNENLLANVPVIINALINATEIGYGRIVAEAIWYDSSSEHEYYSVDKLGIVVLEDEIVVIEDLGGALPLMFPPGYNPPIIPEPTDLNSTKIPPLPPP